MEKWIVCKGNPGKSLSQSDKGKIISDEEPKPYKFGGGTQLESEEEHSSYAVIANLTHEVVSLKKENEKLIESEETRKIFQKTESPRTSQEQNIEEKMLLGIKEFRQ